MTNRTRVSSASGKAAHAAAAAALISAFSFLEHFFPVAALIPVPGIKLGLGNIVLLYLVSVKRYGEALSAAAVKVVLSFFLSGSPVALALSLSGTALSLAAMFLLCPMTKRGFSFVTVSSASSFFFNLAQTAAACVFYTGAVFYYFPVLSAVSLVTGTVTGISANLLFPKINKLIRARGSKPDERYANE